jgi:hypothetical protein
MIPALTQFRMSFKVKAILLVLLAIGALCLHLSFQENSSRAWMSYLVGSVLFIGMGLAGLFMTAIQHLVSAKWSTSIRRIMEAMALTLPVAALLGVGIYFGIHSIYEWSHPEVVVKDALLQWKAPYLNESFFTLRLVIYFVVWVASALFLVMNSLKQDASGDVKYTHRNKAGSAVIIMAFALTVTMGSFDLLMSLEPHWFSTMFGVYFFSMFFQAGIAVMVLLAILLYTSGVLKNFVNVEHFHDLGKFLFAFSVFWWYIAICQYLLIWYADLPEETFWYIERSKNGWQWLLLGILAVRFIAPLLVLLPYRHKRTFAFLIPMSFLVLLGHWLELIWIVKPTLRFFAEGSIVEAAISWKDIGVGLGFFALFFLVVGFIMERMRMVPVGDPRLQASIHHHG